jgi:hypothetical protein
MVWGKLKALLGFKEKEEVLKREILAAMSLYVVNDEKLDSRVKESRSFHNQLKQIYKLQSEQSKAEEKLRKLAALMERVDMKLDEVATPWCRAGTQSQYSVVMREWSRLHTMMLDLVNTMRDWLERVEEERHRRKRRRRKKETFSLSPRIQKEEIVRKTVSFVVREYLPRALAIMKSSWGDKDVTPSWVGTIQPQIFPQPTIGFPIRQQDLGSIGGGALQERRPIVRRPMEEERYD